MLDIGIWSVLTFLSSVARAQCVLRVYVASFFSAQSLDSGLKPRLASSSRSNFFQRYLPILHNNIAMGDCCTTVAKVAKYPAEPSLYVCIVRYKIHANHNLWVCIVSPNYYKTWMCPKPWAPLGHPGIASRSNPSARKKEKQNR